MGLFDRLGRLVRANFTSLVTGHEDPEKVLAQTLTSLQQDLLQVRQAVAQAIALQKRTERQRDLARQKAQAWYDRAQVAIDAGDETLAREALTRRLPHHTLATDLDRQLLEQTSTSERLRTNMLLLEQKLAEARAKRDLYVARAQSAAASQRMHTMLNQFEGGVFDRLNDKTIDLEAQAEAASLSAQGQIDRRFASLEADDLTATIDQELARLKGKRSPGPSA